MTNNQNPGRLEDWVAETHESIVARLEGAKASQIQTRFTLGAMAIISMMMLIASYNAYLSFDNGWVLATTRRQLADEKTVADVLTNQALKDWASSRNVLISLLGIRVSVDDAPILGTLTLFVLSLWLLLLTRRENHTIGFLLRDTDSQFSDSNRTPSTALSRDGQPDMYSSGERWLIFHTIISNSLFVTFDDSLSRVHSLDGTNPLTASTTGFKGRLNRVGFGFVRNFFFLFPVIASFAMFCLDRWSYFLPDPFEPNAAIPGITGRFFWQSLIVFFVGWIPLLVCCYRSSQYAKATEKVLREYGGKLRDDLLQRQQISQRKRTTRRRQTRKV